MAKRIFDAADKAKISLSAVSFTKLTVESALGYEKDFVTEIKKEDVD